MMDTRMTLIRQMTTDFFNKRLAQKSSFMMDTRMKQIKQMIAENNEEIDSRIKLVKQITTDFYYYFDWAVIRCRMPLNRIHLPYLCQQVLSVKSIFYQSLKSVNLFSSSVLICLICVIRESIPSYP